MRSLILAPAVAAAVSTAATAGSAVFVAPEVEMVEQPMSNGSGAWLIPLAVIAILALTLTNNSSGQTTTTTLQTTTITVPTYATLY